MSLIKCEKLNLGYEGRYIIRNLNIEVNDGDYLCIIGENGSGKSTLIKGILNLIRPLKGKIILGNNLKQKEIGYLPQVNTNQKDFPASVYEVVLSGCLNSHKLSPFYSKKDKKLVEENLKKLRIENLKNSCFKDLSGGQQQRVLLARALCATSKILILDEPVTGLDQKTTNDFYKLINQLNKKEGLTIIMISHDIDSVLNYATHILELNKNSYFFGTKENYIEKEGE